MSLWLSDFKFVRGGIYVKATDTLVPVNLANTKDTLVWFTYYMCELTRSLPVKGPVSPEDGMVYQRVIDTSDGDYVTDLRCPSAGGKIDLIYIKRRPADKRFANMNSRCTLARPEDYLSEAERAKLFEFAAAMGLDWGGMDVLRDKTNGLIYVVDVNKTDMGPPIALPLKDKLRSVSILAKSLTRMTEAKAETPK